MQENSNASNDEIDSILSVVYGHLLPLCKQRAASNGGPFDGDVPWWHDFLKNAKVWCQDHSFNTPKDCYVPDDGELQRLYGDAHVHFVWHPKRASYSTYEPLYRALEIPYLSESVVVRPHGEPDATPLERPLFLTVGACTFILTCLQEKFPKDYERCVKTELHIALWNTSEAEADNLVLEFSLGTRVQQKQYSAYWDTKKKCLVHLGDRARKGDVAEMLAKGLLPDRRYKDLADLIELALGESAKEAKVRIRRRNWSPPPEVRELEMREAGSSRGTHTLEEDDPRIVSDDAPESAVTPPSVLPHIPKGDTEPQEFTHGAEARADRSSVKKQEGVEHPSAEPSETEKEGAGNIQEEAPNMADQGLSILSYPDVFRKALDKPSRFTSTEEDLEYGIVSNPSRRRERTRNEIATALQSEPVREDRYEFVRVGRWVAKNEATRVKLREWYGGKCQICGATFQKRNGDPYFEGLYIVSRTRANWIDRPGNVLCLCANCCAQFLYGSVEATSDIMERIKSLRTHHEGGEEMPSFQIALCGRLVNITLNEKHLIDMQQLLSVEEGS